MQLALVMTVIGEDRPGLVDSVAGIVAEQGGNWLESRMSRLGGQFAGILRVQISAEKEAALVRSLKHLETEGLSIVVHLDRPQPEESDRALNGIEEAAIVRGGDVGLHVSLVAGVQRVVDLQSPGETVLAEVPRPRQREIER